MSNEQDKEKPELDVKSLVDQLKESTKIAKTVDCEEFELKPEDLEQFILNNTGKLIKDSMNTIDDIKQYIINAPEPEDVHSLAELYKASTGAIETLNKILIQNQKSKTQLTVKKLDIESKLNLKNTTDDDKISFTRDEVFNKLMEKGNIIDATPTDSEDL